MSGIYIHIPFCEKRCNYCDFFFITNLKLIDEYLSALEKEILLYSAKHKDLNFDSIYFGGGTPSLLSPDKISRIINFIKANFNISQNSEITLEANPEDFLNKNISDYKTAGINRISLGIQSFNDDELKFLTRNHTGKDSEKILSECINVFGNVSADIIYSLPQQKFSDVKKSLDKVISYKTPHVSCYTLTYEEKTVLYKDYIDKKTVKNDAETESELYLDVSKYLSDNGYEHYEVSSYALPGFQAKHNSKYWALENYLGLGPGAHSFINGVRRNNVKNVSKYCKLLAEGILPTDELEKEKYPSEYTNTKSEFIMLSLRASGINLNDYKLRFNESFEKTHDDFIKSLIKNEYALLSDNRLKLTDKGYVLADEITARFL
jgi:oxygen-independent coproporphyrinogen-3 oxidase